jgi:hypothetical protein
MTAWLIIGFGVVVLLLLLVTTTTTVENFLTVDPSTVAAQRQLLQFEGERRYNSFARVQSPLNNINASDVQAAFQTAIPSGTTTTDSLLTLLGTSGRLGAADDGSNKMGAGVEQTGMVQEKINFCESLSINCNLLDDPRAAECGMCHRDGTDSQGRAHRGGLYISSDDQFRANETAVAAGGKAIYQPTIGSCRPENFTLVNENCTARELQMQCQTAGAPGNGCAQCYGASPAGATGLLYVGPLRSYNAVLWLSHPGAHSVGGAGTVITFPNGYKLNVAPSPNHLLAPTPVPIVVTEGDQLTILVFGIPLIWCAWISSPDGNRTVSIDIGETSISPTDSMMILGDKRAPKVLQAVQALDNANAWSSFQNQIPNSVMMYGRRPDLIPPMVISANYGPNSQNAVDVTTFVQQTASTGSSINITPGTLQVSSPIPGLPNYLTIITDTGYEIVQVDGTTVGSQYINNSMQMNFTVPATLIDPIFEDDKIDCPSGPLVATQGGSTLMGSHSCFSANGAFNPSVFCLQELFGAAGGTMAGKGYPGTAAAAAALVQNDPTTGQPSLDATMTYLNNQAQIALYGTDLNNAAVSFSTLSAASMFMFGYTPANPCDVPEAATGPQSPECLAYLWASSGCSPAGQLSPMDANGNINQGNINKVTPYGSSAAIQQQYQEVYNIATQSSDYDLQNEFSLLCFNTSTKQNVVQGANAPEVFQVQSPTGNYQIAQGDAAATCSIFGAQVATLNQMVQANQEGSETCSVGWVADSNTPQVSITSLADVQGCGNGSAGVLPWTPGSGLANVNCYGIKPVAGTENVLPFNSQQWSAQILTGQMYASGAQNPGFPSS